MSIVEIFDTCAKTAKKAERESILLGADKDLVNTILHDVYDKNKTYGVTTKNILVNFDGKLTVDRDYHIFHELLEKLASRELTGNAAIDAVVDTIQKFRANEQQLLLDIIDRNIAIGVSLDSWCKMAGIKQNKFEVPLAYNIEKVNKINPIDGTFFASHKMDGCVSGDTLIEFENGVKLPIATVVDNRMKGKVKSYDETTGEIVYRDIEDWMHNVEDVNPSQKQWYEIELANGKILKITGNDSLYVNGKGWVKVEDLTEDDEILIE